MVFADLVQIPTREHVMAQWLAEQQARTARDLYRALLRIVDDPDVAGRLCDLLLRGA
jgi:hypothetical protein